MMTIRNTINSTKSHPRRRLTDIPAGRPLTDMYISMIRTGIMLRESRSSREPDIPLEVTAKWLPIPAPWVSTCRNGTAASTGMR